MRRIFLVAFLSLLAIALVTCRKPDPDPEPPAVCQYDSSVEEMKKWYYFKTGTWWVYQEQTTGALDTITVYYDWEGFNPSGTQGFETWCTSSYDGYNQYYSFNDSYSIHCLTSEECLCHKVERARGRPGEFVGAGWLFLYPLIEGNFSYQISSDGTQYGQTISTQVLDSLVFNGKQYGSVVIWDVDLDGSEGDVPAIYSIAQNVGIIRYEYPESNETWVMLECNIIQ
jgi:hypothetical protein